MVMRSFRKISYLGGNDKQCNLSRTFRISPFAPRQLILFLLFLLNSHPFCLSLLVYIVYNYGTSELEETVGGISLMKKHGFKSDM